MDPIADLALIAAWVVLLVWVVRGAVKAARAEGAGGSGVPPRESRKAGPR